MSAAVDEWGVSMGPPVVWCGDLPHATVTLTRGDDGHVSVAGWDPPDAKNVLCTRGLIDEFVAWANDVENVLIERDAAHRECADLQTEADGLRLERDTAQQEAAGMFDPPGLDVFRLSPVEVETALYRLGQLPHAVGPIPVEVTAWLAEILCRRDRAAGVLAERLAEVGP